MITDILTYINSYDDVRAVCGLNTRELPDATLALNIYKHKLGVRLNSISGKYDTSEVDQTLQVIYDDDLDTTSAMYANIQMLSVYTVADAVLESVGLRAYKSMADGKSNITRFSPESTYLETRNAVRDGLNDILENIYEIFGETSAASSFLTVVTPDVDLVLGE